MTILVIFGTLWVNNSPVRAEENIDQTLNLSVSDLRIVKIQLRDTNNGKIDKVNQFVVIKNYGAVVNLTDWRLEVYHDGQLKRTTTLEGAELPTGAVLVIANNQALAQPFLNGDELVRYFAKADRQQNWLHVSKGNYQLRLLKGTDSSPSAEAEYVIDKLDYDVRSLSIDSAGNLVNNWQTLTSRDQNGAVWLKTSQLPLVELPETPLPQLCLNENEELINGKCLTKCEVGFQRQGENCVSICSEAQELLAGRCVDKCSSKQERVNDICVDKCQSPQVRVNGQCRLVCADGYEPGYTGTCVKKCENGYQRSPETNRCNKIQTIGQKNCPEGYLLNPDTNRCNKLAIEEIKTCRAGYYLHPETNRCRKIPEEPIISACPVGQYRHPETNRCRKIMFEPEACQDGYELGFNNNCVKKCESGYQRSPETNRCRKIETVCQAGFTKDLKTGICVKAVAETKSNQTGIATTDQTKQINFDWLKILNSPISGAVAASIVFAIYDKLFRK